MYFIGAENLYVHPTIKKLYALNIDMRMIGQNCLFVTLTVPELNSGRDVCYYELSSSYALTCFI